MGAEFKCGQKYEVFSRTMNLGLLINEDLRLLVCRDLTDDDLDKVSVLQKGLRHENGQNVMSSRRAWIEILYVLQRYDLMMKHFGVCQHQASKLVAAEPYFPFSSKLLVQLIDGITDSMMLDLRKAHAEIFSAPASPLSEFLLHLFRANKTEALEKIFPNVLPQDWAVLKSDIQNLYSDTYPMKTSPIGRCLIFDFFQIGTSSPRFGSDVDRAKLEKTFEGLEFKVECHQNLTLDSMQNVLEKERRRDHSAHSAFVCCVLSHGNNGTFLTSDGHEFRVRNLIATFCGDRCPTLNRKPKVFLVAACQGSSFCKPLQECNDVESNHKSDVVIKEECDMPMLITNPVDCLVGYAAYVGTSAVRLETGSWFVNAFVKAIRKTTIMEEVRAEVIRSVSSRMGKFAGKYVSQTPIWEDTLSHKLVFRKKEESVEDWELRTRSDFGET